MDYQIQDTQTILDLTDLLEGITSENVDVAISKIKESAFFSKQLFWKLSYFILESIRCRPHQIESFVVLIQNLCSHPENGQDFQQSFLSELQTFDLLMYSHITLINLLVSKGTFEESIYENQLAKYRSSIDNFPQNGYSIERSSCAIKRDDLETFKSAFNYNNNQAIINRFSCLNGFHKENTFDFICITNASKILNYVIEQKNEIQPFFNPYFVALGASPETVKLLILHNLIDTEELYFQAIHFHRQDLLFVLQPNYSQLCHGLQIALDSSNFRYLVTHASTPVQELQELQGFQDKSQDKSQKKDKKPYEIFLNSALKHEKIDALEIIVHSPRVNNDLKLVFDSELLFKPKNFEILKHFLKFEENKPNNYYLLAARCISPTIGPQIVQFLANSGFPGVNQTDDEGNSPLILAIELGHESTALALLDLGADILMGKHNCLIEAVSSGLCEVIKRILPIYSSKDIDITQFRSSFGLTAIQLAADRNHVDIVNILLSDAKNRWEKSKKNVEKTFMNPSLLAEGFVEAARFGRTELLETFLNCPTFESNSILSNGKSLLASLCRMDKVDYIKMLKKQTVLFDPAALLTAISANALPLITYLMEFRDFDVNLIDPLTKTPAIVEAVNQNKADILQLLLLDSTIDLNATDSKNRTALFSSVYNHFFDLTQILLSTIPDNLSSLPNQTPQNNNKLIDVNKADENGYTPLMCAVMSNDLNTVSALLSIPYTDVNLFDKQKMETALMKALLDENETMASLLLSDERIDIEIRDKTGATPLMRAVEKDMIPIVSKLVSLGANTNVKNIEGVKLKDLVSSESCKKLLKL